MIFQKPPLNSLPLFKDRWSPLYLEHGRLEVDDSSVIWITKGLYCPLPIATISAIILGPGTSITHAAIKAIAECNVFLCWAGENGFRFYSKGLSTNFDSSMALTQARFWGTLKTKNLVARRMFKYRFTDIPDSGLTIKQLRGMEGIRVRKLYSKLGTEFGVSWKGRHYNSSNWNLSDDLNQNISSSTAYLYSLIGSLVCSMGFIPQLGFVHTTTSLPFIYDIADLFKHEISWPAAFQALSIDPNTNPELVKNLMQERIISTKLFIKAPNILKSLFDDPINNT